MKIREFKGRVRFAIGHKHFLPLVIFGWVGIMMLDGFPDAASHDLFRIVRWSLTKLICYAIPVAIFVTLEIAREADR